MPMPQRPSFGSIEPRPKVDPTSFRAVWRARGEKQTKTFDTHQEACDFLEEQAIAMRRGHRPSDLRKGRTLWSAYAWEWLRARPDTPNTHASRLREQGAVKKFEQTFGDTAIADITRRAVQEWINAMSEDPAWECEGCEDEQIATGDDEARCLDHAEVKVLAGRTMADYYQVIGQIMREAVLDDYLPNGCPLGKGLHVLPAVERREVWIDDEETDHLLAECLRMFPAHYAMVHLAAHTGMRLGEIRGLLRGAYKTDPRDGTKYLTVKKAAKKGRTIGPTKTNKSRRIELFECCVEVLDDHLAGHEFGLVFPGQGGRVLSVDNWRHRVWNPLRNAAGFEEINLHFHDLRHSHCTNLLVAGWKVEVVSNRLGHSSVKMTYDRYRHVIADEQKDAIARHGTRARRLHAV